MEEWSDSLDGSEEVGVLDGLVDLLGEGVAQVLVLGEGDRHQLLLLLWLWLRQLLSEDRLMIFQHVQTFTGTQTSSNHFWPHLHHHQFQAVGREL